MNGVAPLRRCGGKPISKARDHVMLKPDRPPHVTILCLVRDAAVRLRGNIGTRAEVCTLIWDSQYMVEDISDAQVNQVVSEAWDPLHYERDPCVQFEGERKLWVYLHRSRDEEDFDDDGTSSTKKWKRRKKNPFEQDDHVTVAPPESVEPTDLNAEPPCTNDDKVVELTHDDTRGKLEAGAEKLCFLALFLRNLRKFSENFGLALFFATPLFVYCFSLHHSENPGFAPGYTQLPTLVMILP